MILLSPPSILALGFMTLILLGSLLLMLPIAHHGDLTWIQAIFTSTSAVTITGLSVVNVGEAYTVFGKVVIMLLLQCGGLGFMTFAILRLVLTKRKISLSQRSIMQNSISAPQIGGIVRMTKFIALGTVTIEVLGAILLSFSFIPRFGVAKGIYFSLFHSISAFCNAGFDLMGGTTGEFSSLTGVVGDWYVNIIIMLLIFVGGLGFFVWHDLGVKRFRFKKLKLQSKMVLSSSVSLVFLGAFLLFILEYSKGALAGMPIGQKIVASLFQSVTARTAGFKSVDLTAMTESGIIIMICLMFIGGSTGSTAGGIKTTTFWVLCVSIFTTFRRKKNVEAFGRRLEESITRTASCVFMTYLLLTVSVAVVISAIEDIPLLTTLFESVSAMATVGLTMGITPELGMVSKLLLAFLMLCGRVGSITMLLAFSSEKRVTNSKLPLEKIQVG